MGHGYGFGFMRNEDVSGNVVQVLTSSDVRLGIVRMVVKLKF